MTPRPELTSLTLGFIPLTDCAPLVIAQARGLFKAEGLDVNLSREASWANIRDKVLTGALDGAHMLAPMAIACSLGADGPARAIIAPMALNANGSSLGVSTALAAQMEALCGRPASGLGGAEALKTIIDLRSSTVQRPLTFAVVFPFSIHNYMLRYWLASGGVDPDQDLRIIVAPPPRIAARMAMGDIDGFCVGAPWGGLVEGSGAGGILLHGAQFWPGAPDKVFGVTEEWAARYPETLQAVMRALIRAAIWADDPENERELAGLLEQPDYIDAPVAALNRALSKSNPYGIRFHEGGVGRPRPADALWLLSQMQRWGQVEAGLQSAARAVYRPDLYDKAATAVGSPLASTQIESRPLPPLFDGGVFDPDDIDGYVASFEIGRPIAPTKRA
jgi:NitT/TauT family transport system ATP-binding protein/nitrate/nitrite transport system substrate-binding protein